jgi:glycine/sarcosine N-methyltransferase
MNWYNNFFDNTYLKWEGTISSNYFDTCREQVEELSKSLKFDDENVILNCGCGGGYHDYFLKSKVRHIVGIDFSEQMLSKAKKLNPDVEYNYINFCNPFSIPIRADFAIFFNTTFGYSDEEKQIQILKNVSENLSDTGKVILDLINPYSFFQNYRKEIIFKLDSGEIIQKSKLDIERQVLKNRWIISQGKVEESRYFEIHYYYPNDIKYLCDKSNLKLKSIFGNYDGSPFSIDSPREIVILERM